MHTDTALRNKTHANFFQSLKACFRFCGDKIFFPLFSGKITEIKNRPCQKNILRQIFKNFFMPAKDEFRFQSALLQMASLW